ncbi:MAG: Mov34/MPN/PAD-1 family protein [Methanomassiliicoccus sp.]|nr:Mov34/MPN/PAD-1 family protein [Methanomassiliicoccus sp.]
MTERRKVWGIDPDVLEMVNEAAKESLPNEFVAALRAENGVITEILLFPGSYSNEHSAFMQLHMLPIDLSVVGTVHSHPGPSNRPSDADLHLFGNFGNTHIITCLPFDKRSWRAYDRNGREVGLEVVDL